MSDFIDHMETVAAAATKGPWHWSGNTKTHHIYLATWLPGAGRCQVLGQKRWGTQSAKPQFLTSDIMLVDADALAVYEVARNQGLPDNTPADDPRIYRHDIVDIDHPDARHMVTSSPENVLALIAELRRAQAAIARVQAVAKHWEETSMGHHRDVTKALEGEQ